LDAATGFPILDSLREEKQSSKKFRNKDGMARIRSAGGRELRHKNGRSDKQLDQPIAPSMLLPVCASSGPPRSQNELSQVPVNFGGSTAVPAPKYLRFGSYSLIPIFVENIGTNAGNE
jgi:hypothetical protein